MIPGCSTEPNSARRPIWHVEQFGMYRGSDRTLPSAWHNVVDVLSVVLSVVLFVPAAPTERFDRFSGCRIWFERVAV